MVLQSPIELKKPKDARDALLRHSGKEVLFGFKTTGPEANKDAARIREESEKRGISTSEMVRRGLNAEYHLGIQEKDEYHERKKRP